MGPPDPHNPEEALAVALRLLRARDKTRAQLHEALLHRGFDERTCEDVAARLTQLGYLNDNRLAEARAQKLLETGYGPLGVQERLRRMGIEEATSARAVNEAQASAGVEEREQARYLIERRWKDGWPKAPKERARAARLLLARGFSEDIVGQLLGDGALEFEDPAD